MCLGICLGFRISSLEIFLPDCGTDSMKTSTFEQCIKCSICNAFCPVLKATGVFPGPKLSGPDAERFRRRGQGIPPAWLEFCDLCRMCETVCPHKVPITGLHLRSRKVSTRGFRAFLRDWLLGHSHLLQKVGCLGAPFSNWILRWSFSRWLLDRGLGIDSRAKFPDFHRPGFVQWFRSRSGAEGEPVGYFHGCYTNYIDAAVGQAVVQVLEKNGLRVILPRQECCGLPLIGNGLCGAACGLAKKNLDSLTAFTAQGTQVIFSSPSCGLTLTREYERSLNLPGASRLAALLSEVCQFLLRLYDQGRLNTAFREIPETVYYHVPCHLRALQIGLPALDLLSLVPGLKTVELPASCCGLAGTYGYKREKYGIAREIGEDTFRRIREDHARTVISECEACRMQIEHHTGVATLHPVQVLNRAYGD